MRLTAPAGMTGHVHASGSGKSYAISEDGHIDDVHHHDVGALMRLGFSQDGTVNDPPPPPQKSAITQEFVAGETVVE